MIGIVLRQLEPHTILAGVFALFALPFALVMLFPAQLDRMMAIESYLVFHNSAEFFSIMVSLCVFSVGWFTYDQSKNRHALFLGAAFLAVGLIDFMHTLSNAAMPAFFSPNSANKSTQFWISARILGSAAFLASAFIYPDSQSRFLSRKPLMTAALGLSGVVLCAFTFFQSWMPATAIQGVGLTPLKKYAEYLVITLLVAAFVFYRQRMKKTGDRMITYYLAAFIICIFSAAVFASYTTGFDTYNVIGHFYKIIAFYLIYKALFVEAVKNPYIKLKEYATKLEQSNQDLLDFSFVASHDLQEPLRKIRTFADRLKSGEKERISDRGMDFLDKMEKSASRMQALLSDLRKYSRSQITSSEPMTQVDLKECALEAVADLKEMCDRMEGTVEIGEFPPFQANGVQMRELFQNLICNALKYCGPERPHVKVYSGCSGPDGSLEIYVQDNGIGFDECYLDRIFKPFQRLHGKDSPYDGAGMGLTICRKIVERHNGTITATSDPGKGSTFIVRLPQAK